jgi:hypothetical protein
MVFWSMIANDRKEFELLLELVSQLCVLQKSKTFVVRRVKENDESMCEDLG